MTKRARAEAAAAMSRATQYEDYGCSKCFSDGRVADSKYGDTELYEREQDAVKYFDCLHYQSALSKVDGSDSFQRQSSLKKGGPKEKDLLDMKIINHEPNEKDGRLNMTLDIAAHEFGIATEDIQGLNSDEAVVFTPRQASIAIADCLLRCLYTCVKSFNRDHGSGSDKFEVYRPGQYILPTGALILYLHKNNANDKDKDKDKEGGDTVLTVRVKISHNNPSTDLDESRRLLSSLLISWTKHYSKADRRRVDNINANATPRVAKQLKQLIRPSVGNLVDICYIRQQMDVMGAVAFVANGSILPRAGGSSDKHFLGSLPQTLRGCEGCEAHRRYNPRWTNTNTNTKSSTEKRKLVPVPAAVPEAVPFVSPPSMQASFSLPYSGRTVNGMLVKKGVTIIAGGGFHGKSTLLRAISSGVYDKVAGDGREHCITIRSAACIRAEDGRSVSHVDISPFLSDLPKASGLVPERFSTSGASGSTSQAAAVVEALEIGSRLLLLDEDTSAVNFMIRDSRMRSLVQNEPITPFIYRVNALHLQRGVSTIVVVGGAGDWFDVQDTTLHLDNYSCADATARARSISKTFSHGRVQFNGQGLVHQLSWPGVEWEGEEKGQGEGCYDVDDKNKRHKSEGDCAPVSSAVSDEGDKGEKEEREGERGTDRVFSVAELSQLVGVGASGNIGGSNKSGKPRKGMRVEGDSLFCAVPSSTGSCTSGTSDTSSSNGSGISSVDHVTNLGKIEQIPLCAPHAIDRATHRGQQQQLRGVEVALRWVCSMQRGWFEDKDKDKKGTNDINDTSIVTVQRVLRAYEQLLGWTADDSDHGSRSRSHNHIHSHDGGDCDSFTQLMEDICKDADADKEQEHEQSSNSSFVLPAPQVLGQVLNRLGVRFHRRDEE